MASPSGGITPDALAQLTVTSLEDGKAEDIVVIDLRGRSFLADHMVIASGNSSRQLAALADNLSQKLKAAGQSVTAEGLSVGDWVLLDTGDLIVHLFRPEIRSFYNLEKIWQSET